MKGAHATARPRLSANLGGLVAEAAAARYRTGQTIDQVATAFSVSWMETAHWLRDHGVFAGGSFIPSPAQRAELEQRALNAGAARFVAEPLGLTVDGLATMLGRRRGSHEHVDELSSLDERARADIVRCYNTAGHSVTRLAADKGVTVKTISTLLAHAKVSLRDEDARIVSGHLLNADQRKRILARYRERITPDALAVEMGVASAVIRSVLRDANMLADSPEDEIARLRDRPERVAQILARCRDDVSARQVAREYAISPETVRLLLRDHGSRTSTPSSPRPPSSAQGMRQRTASAAAASGDHLRELQERAIAAAFEEGATIPALMDRFASSERQITAILQARGLIERAAVASRPRAGTQRQPQHQARRHEARSVDPAQEEAPRNEATARDVHAEQDSAAWSGEPTPGTVRKPTEHTIEKQSPAAAVAPPVFRPPVPAALFLPPVPGQPAAPPMMPPAAVGPAVPAPGRDPWSTPLIPAAPAPAPQANTASASRVSATAPADLPADPVADPGADPGVPGLPPGISDNEADRIATAYRQGRRLDDLARGHMLTEDTVLQVLRSRGVRIRATAPADLQEPPTGGTRPSIPAADPAAATVPDPVVPASPASEITIDPAVEQQITDGYRNGLTVHDLMTRLQVDRAVVTNVLDRHQLARGLRGRRLLSDAQITEIVHRYTVLGHSSLALADAYGVSEATIHTYLQAHGVTRRERNDPIRVISLAEQQEIIDFHDAGEAAEEISRAYGVDPQRVTAILAARTRPVGNPDPEALPHRFTQRQTQAIEYRYTVLGESVTDLARRCGVSEASMETTLRNQGVRLRRHPVRILTAGEINEIVELCAARVPLDEVIETYAITSDRLEAIRHASKRARSFDPLAVSLHPVAPAKPKTTLVPQPVREPVRKAQQVEAQQERRNLPGPKPMFSDDQVKEMIAAYQAGTGSPVLAERYQTTPKTILRTLQRHGITPTQRAKAGGKRGTPTRVAEVAEAPQAETPTETPIATPSPTPVSAEDPATVSPRRKPGRQPRFTGVLAAEIAAAYQAGEGSVSLARRYKTAASTILHVVRAHGITPRPRPGAQPAPGTTTTPAAMTSVAEAPAPDGSAAEMAPAPAPRRRAKRNRADEAAPTAATPAATPAPAGDALETNLQAAAPRRRSRAAAKPPATKRTSPKTTRPRAKGPAAKTPAAVEKPIRFKRLSPKRTESLVYGFADGATVDDLAETHNLDPQQVISVLQKHGVPAWALGR